MPSLSLSPSLTLPPLSLSLVAQPKSVLLWAILDTSGPSGLDFVKSRIAKYHYRFPRVSWNMPESFQMRHLHKLRRGRSRGEMHSLMLARRVNHMKTSLCLCGCCCCCCWCGDKDEPLKWLCVFADFTRSGDRKPWFIPLKLASGRHGTPLQVVHIRRLTFKSRPGLFLTHDNNDVCGRGCPKHFLGWERKRNEKRMWPGVVKAERAAKEMKSTWNHEGDWLTGTD